MEGIYIQFINHYTQFVLQIIDERYLDFYTIFISGHLEFTASIYRWSHGHSLTVACHRAIRGIHHFGVPVRATEEINMNWLYLVGLVITVAMFIYLIVALLKPEYFS